MIRPIITYGSTVYGNAVKTILEKIKTFQNKLLHSFTKVTPYGRSHAIHRDIKINTTFVKKKKNK